MKVKSRREVIWSPLHEPGIEQLTLLQTDDGIHADSLVIGVDYRTAFRLHYELRCDPQWRVRELSVSLLGDQPRELQLRADGNGHWRTPQGQPIAQLDGAIDVDIAVTPFTNTLPIRRLNLNGGESALINVLYIAVPQLEAQLVQQRYTCLERGFDYGRYLYESLESGYTAELSVDADGFVRKYPNVFHMLWLVGDNVDDPA